MKRESIIEVTLSDGRKIKFPPRQTVHTNHGPFHALTLSRISSIMPCCIADQQPHEEPPEQVRARRMGRA